MRILYITTGSWGTTFHINSHDPSHNPVFLKPVDFYNSFSPRLFHKIIKRGGKKTVLQFIDEHTGSLKVDLGKSNIEILKILSRIDLEQEEYRNLKDLDSKDILSYLVVKEFSLKVTK